MPGFMPGIHVLNLNPITDVDDRDIGERKRRRSSNEAMLGQERVETLHRQLISR
jgi:hypothetical protein